MILECSKTSQKLHYMTQIFKYVHMKSLTTGCQLQHVPTTAMLNVFCYHKHNSFLKCVIDRNRQRKKEQKIDFPHLSVVHVSPETF